MRNKNYFPLNAHYDDMNRKEKRAYERYLHKQKLWDGAIVIKNLRDSGDLEIDESFSSGL